MKAKGLKPKNLRASDQSSFYAKGRKDFTVRKHNFSAAQLYNLILAVVLIAGGVTFIVYKNTLNGAVLSLLLGIALFIYAKHMERFKKMLTTTEFLNALFSSIVSDDYKFIMIVNIELGEIVYLNNAFQKIFPDMLPMPKREIKTLLEIYKITESASILSSIKSSEKSDITTKAETGKDRKISSISWSIEPISRPSGFCLIRGQ